MRDRELELMQEEADRKNHYKNRLFRIQRKRSPAGRIEWSVMWKKGVLPKVPGIPSEPFLGSPYRTESAAISCAARAERDILRLIDRLWEDLEVEK